MLKYNPHNRFAGIADETKLLLAVCLSVIILFVNIIAFNLILLLIFFTLALTGGLSIRMILGFIRMFLPFFLIIFLLHLFYHDGRVLMKIWFLTASDTGLYSGVLNLLRFVNFLMIAICFFSFSSPLIVSTRLATFFGLAKGHFFQEIALIFFIALRFLPVLMRERKTLNLAMRARGIDYKSSRISRIKINVRMLLPLFTRVIGQTEDVAAALALKGNGSTYFMPDKPSLKTIDYLLIISGFFLAIGTIYYA